MLFPLLHHTLQIPVRISILQSHHHAHYTVAPVSVLFILLIDVFRHPRDVVTCVCPDDDGCHHTERVLRISLHRRRSKSHSRAIRSLVKLSDEPVSCRYDHHVTCDI